MAEDALEPANDDVLLVVLDGEFGLYMAWGNEIAAKAPAWGGAPLPERLWHSDAGFVQQLLAQGIADPRDGAVFRLDYESQELLARGGRLAVDKDGRILPQIYEDGHRGVRRKARLVDVDEFDDGGGSLEAAVITSAVQDVIDRYEEELARYEQQLAAQSEVLHKILLFQYGAWSAQLDAHLSVLGELLALVRDGQHLDLLEGNLAVQAEREANAAVALAISQLSRLWELASQGPLTNRRLRALANELEAPETEFWLQHLTRGKILASLALALQLHGRDDIGAVRAGVLRQRMHDLGTDWAERLEVLTATVTADVHRDDRRVRGAFQRGRARQLESRLEELSDLYGLISQPAHDLHSLIPGLPQVRPE
ncbi:hypothetical protein [Salsipaludibacter albus]|uniref:hypothetical protein n=1 Tax=Salsipaludibacter albus TaxID=2849650 RepID=UPI001EE47F99|nr:hypothetical protein [Salsipaludibacter albus]MBY5163153.1 hypothetical protein [Salsipaludibacter albus]